MSGGKPKPRKGNGSSWRVKRVDPTLPRRYSRADLLALYSSSAAPTWLDQTFITDILLDPGQVPVFDHLRPFAHTLGEDPSSRPTAKMPDWYSDETGNKSVDRPHREVPVPGPVTEPDSKPQPQEVPVRPVKVVIDKKAVIRNLPKEMELFRVEMKDAVTVRRPVDLFMEEYSELDRQMDRKLAGEESDDEIPEWAVEPIPESASGRQGSLKDTPVDIPVFESRPPRLNASLLRERVSAKDPFAQLLYQQGAPDGTEYVCCVPYSLPLERAWYYRAHEQVLGPFSTIEMYNWSLMGRFNASQLFAWRTPSVQVTLAELQRAPAHFWQGEPNLSQLERPKHTLEIDPNHAIKSVLGRDLWSLFDTSEC